MKPLDYEQIKMRCTELGMCLLWDQGVNSSGYPQARINGKPMLVSHYVLYTLMGKMKRRGYVASPICRNKLCVSQDCLRSLTCGELLRRTYASGARPPEGEYMGRVMRYVAQGKAKCSFEIADDIRANKMDVPNTVLAKELGVHPKTVYQMKRGKSWVRSLPGSSIFAQR